ncbi:MAG: Hexaprenyldihydroxybenzoate methyltransferase, mitochondrial [Geoglossum umbratile]|nr:MAG: Hexaprenyldihydroxybenzoate methyltransferase, mitochondrial [Geoglossum umbratile]
MHKHCYLDTGCVGEIFAESVALLPVILAVVVLDPSPSIYRAAIAHAKIDPTLADILAYYNTPLEALPPRLPAGQYDILTLLEVIGHLAHPSPFL